MNRLPESRTEENWIHESATGIAFTNRRVKEALGVFVPSVFRNCRGLVKWQTSEEQRICITFCFQWLLKITKHFKQHFVLMPCIGHKPLNDTRFKSGQTSGEDSDHSGCPSSIRMDESV